MGERNEKQALILVYTGEGKGKTSAAVGQAVRALGAGMSVGFGQFFKRDSQSGEQNVLKKLLSPDMFLASGEGFYRDGRDHERHRDKALTLLDWARDKIQSGTEMLVLDEVLYALSRGLIQRQELEFILDGARDKGTNLVLTGRDLPEWLRDRADLVSEIHLIKHHFEQNISARKGIEF
ncbi:cob(I)yrinic acid a,c-diamide adenosyltransferase [Desulfonatronospira sp. MSAO_Bac3]|uniref:cob(I)yrinic acid a,c-diamide adenosyltransferase n=1 Tax=Desulfonatronospira sp. MSAO_Bac3 TaxID=2293857 RepID=UPI000FEDAF5C|nr:cob(I)yrinic acid a,c-diamide adenosyltransferase [Desulfonatronospira sp. MSAO_Bac3]RQD76255.1 MAG: cob(I)alamin adenolsyltransferase [Desulfonatronospira sp. MSAO_Bac3]